MGEQKGQGEVLHLNTKNLIHLINIMFSVDYTRFTMRHYTIQQDGWENYATRRKSTRDEEFQAEASLPRTYKETDGFCLAEV